MRSQDAINVAAACDNEYAQHLSVMLVSLLENNPGRRFRVFLLTTADSDAVEKIAESCADHDCRLTPLRIDPGPLNGLQTGKWFTQAIHYRLLLGDILPAEIHRVLYLDADIVSIGAIAELWDTDLGNNVIGAVPDEGFRFRQKLGFGEGEPYFNSGVMLIDLDRWRRSDAGRTAIAAVRDEPHRITWPDQCALNLALRGRWTPLDRKWNLQTNAVGQDVQYGVIATAQGLDRLRDAIIIHFTNQAKPWQYLCEHPAKPHYWHYLKKTPWRNYRMPDLSARNVVRKILAFHFPSVLKAYWTARRFLQRAFATSA